MISSPKLAINLLISFLATYILSIRIISISTNNWKIGYESSTINQTGSFRQCSNTLRCDTKELNRLMALLALLGIILLVIGTLASFVLIGIAINDGNRCYILVSLTPFVVDIVMHINPLEKIFFLQTP